DAPVHGEELVEEDLAAEAELYGEVDDGILAGDDSARNDGAVERLGGADGGDTEADVGREGAAVGAQEAEVAEERDVEVRVATEPLGLGLRGRHGGRR